MSEQAATPGRPMGDAEVRHRAYTREVGDDGPDVRESATAPHPRPAHPRPAVPLPTPRMCRPTRTLTD